MPPTVPTPAPLPILSDPPAYAARVLAGAERAAAKRAADPDEAVHELRVAIKRMRALWALIEPLVGRPLANRQNDALRDAARTMTGLREAHVMLDTLRLVTGRSRSARVHRACALVRGAFGAPSSASVENALLDRALGVLRDSAALLALLPWQGWGWGAVEPGMRRAYRQGRRRLRGFGAGQDDEAFHDWRKAAKRLQYQLEFSEHVSPEARTAHRRIRTLGRILGDAHDVAVLRHRVIALEEKVPAAELRALRASLERMLRRLYNGALLAGLSFYHQAPLPWAKGLGAAGTRAPSRVRARKPRAAPGLAGGAQSG